MSAPLVTQPGFTRTLTAVRTGEIGLLRAAALDLVATGDGQALDALGAEAIALLRAATGSTSVELQAHASADGRAATFLGRAGHGIVVSAHLSLIVGEGQQRVHAKIRLVGTHGSVLVDLLRPQLEVRTAAGTTRVPHAAPRAAAAPEGTTEILAAIADSARSGRTTSTTW